MCIVYVRVGKRSIRMVSINVYIYVYTTVIFVNVNNN